MGGGRVMATAAKVAGIGVAKGGFRGGFGVPAAANDQFIVRNTSASKPVSASISSAVHPSVEEDAVVMRKPVWEDEWEFAEVETKTIPRVVFDKPPSLQEAKEATDDLKDALNMACMEGSNEVGSVSRMFSSFQPSENRAVESAVPQVALKAFAFLSENTAAQSVVTSIASDPKVWDAVMENKDLMKFLETNTASTKDEADNDDKSELSSETESEEDSEEKPIQLMEILRDMKLKAVQMMENVSSYFGGLFRTETFTEGGQERKRMLLNDPTTLFGLAVCVIFMVVLKRA
ncbi:hypothetical protein HID58_087734 [Brassica napus]|uniref:BnaCnng45510D protein n=2 Tax=Brassica napus TaxID=3708 RepID=A0A078JE39_BRANA|nr:uncharacterized protein BNACNNG45510D [Brassica napus]XP_048630382.1 uncharacterized protein LOC125603330 [Brassica napus]KAH0849405.1 hypothetical protein HID58_096430 [Brassica napus]KAH0859473.1 hypothetical protein HID58_087734 [Brassica napus]CAF1759623.1 unnamed protein product [Brassica napus]CDY64929.1 BnaCnng45510D [Brassica napus]